MTQRHELRWGGIAGLAFLVLAFLASLLPGSPPSVADSRDTISTFVTDGRTQLLFSALLYAAAAGLVIWFSAAFAEAIREREDRSDVHMALLAGSVLVGGAIFTLGAATAVMAYGAKTLPVFMTVAVFKGTMVVGTLIGFAAALPLAAAGIGVLRTRVMPNWLGYIGLVAAGISILAGFGVFFDTGMYAPGGALMPYVSLVAGGVFVLCASIFMVREHLPEVTPRTLPQT